MGVEHASRRDGMPEDGVIETTIESSDRTGYSIDVSAEEDGGNNTFIVNDRGENPNDTPTVDVIGSDTEELDLFPELSLEAGTENDTEAASDSGRHTSGSLDEYFLDQPDMFPSF